MSAVTVCAEYLALTIARRTGARTAADADGIADLVGLDPAHVDRLLRARDLAAIVDRRRQLDTLTAPRCVWRCRRCGEVGPYTPALDHFRDHWHARQHGRYPERTAA